MLRRPAGQVWMLRARACVDLSVREGKGSAALRVDPPAIRPRGEGGRYQQASRIWHPSTPNLDVDENRPKIAQVLSGEGGNTAMPLSSFFICMFGPPTTTLTGWMGGWMGFHMLCRGHRWNESLNHFEMDKCFFFFRYAMCTCICVYSAMCVTAVYIAGIILFYEKRFSGDAECDGCDACDRAAAEAVASASGAATSNEVH